MLTLLLVTVCIFFWLFWRFVRKTEGEPPTVKGALPLIGHAHKLLFGDIHRFWDVVLEATNDCLQKGGLTKTTFAVWNLYVITDPEVAGELLNTCLEKDQLYKFWDLWVGDGLLTGPVSVWRPNRKLMLPAFSQRLLNEFLPMFNLQSRQLADRLSEKVGKAPFDISHDLASNGLQTFCATMLGQREEFDKEFVNQYLDGVQKFHKSSLERFGTAQYHNEFIFKLSKMYQEDIKTVAGIRKLSEKIIETRKKTFMNNNATCNHYTDGTSEKNDRLLIDLLIQLNSQGLMSDKQMKDELDTAIFGGHDTSAGSLMYALILLGSHPHVQEKLYDEIQNVLGGSDEVTKHDLPKLVYLEAVIKESMRLYPIMAFLARYVDRDLKIKNHVLKAGGRAVVVVYGMHRSACWGPDADEFRPERWLTPGEVPDYPAAFATFSYGKRGCIGKTYAMMSMKVILAHLVRRYRFKADHTQLKIKFEVVMKPVCGHHVSIEHRTN